MSVEHEEAIQTLMRDLPELSRDEADKAIATLSEIGIAAAKAAEVVSTIITAYDCGSAVTAIDVTEVLS